MLAEQPQHGAGQFQMPYGGTDGAYPQTPTDHYNSRAPLFQRLDAGGGDHFSELQDSQRELEKYRQKAFELERMYSESEKILTAQGKQRMDLEAKLAETQRSHEREMKANRAEVLEWQKRYTTLQHQNNKLADKLNRVERELMGVLAKKYEIVQQAKAEARKQVLEEEAIKRDVSRLIARRNTTSGGAMDAAAVQALQNLKLRELQERRQQEDAADEAAERQRKAAAEEDKAKGEAEEKLILPETGTPSAIRSRLASATLDDFFGL